MKAYIEIIAIICALYFLFDPSIARSQNIDNLNFEGLSPKAIELVEQKLKSVSSFDSLRTSIQEISEELLSNGYSYHQKEFELNGDANEIFSLYTSVSPSEIWSGPHNIFCFLFSREDQKFLTLNDQLPCIREGMQLFNVVDFLGPKFLFGMEIIKIDYDILRIEFAYLEGNISSGIQVLQFIQDGEHTIISHHSYYKSESNFRDQFIYPIFHDHVINEYHYRMEEFYNLSDRNIRYCSPY